MYHRAYALCVFFIMPAHHLEKKKVLVGVFGGKEFKKWGCRTRLRRLRRDKKWLLDYRLDMPPNDRINIPKIIPIIMIVINDGMISHKGCSNVSMSSSPNTSRMPTHSNRHIVSIINILSFFFKVLALFVCGGAFY